MAGRHQHLAQLEMVVDLAVLHDPDRRVLVVDGLVAALDVDDREAAQAEGDAAAGNAPVPLGAPRPARRRRHRRSHTSICYEFGPTASHSSLSACAAIGLRSPRARRTRTCPATRDTCGWRARPASP